jgi:hypothetical protein
MKQILLSITLAVFTFLNSFSQNCNAVFFSNSGEQFQVVLNGQLLNHDFQTNVKAENLNANAYKVSVIFENQTIPPLKKTIYFQEPNKEYTYEIKQGKKGWVLRFAGVAPLPVKAASTPSNLSTSNPNTVNTVNNNSQTINETTVTQTTTNTTAPSGENISVGMDMNGMGVNMNVNINDNTTGENVSTNTSVSTTTTTTTTSTTVTQSGNNYGIPPASTEPVLEPTTYNGYGGNTGCSWPMDQAAFANVKKSIAAKSFEDSKLTIAKQVTRSKCLLAKQVKEIMQLFTYEDSKLEFAKYAYDYTYDIDNYFMVNDAFEFETSIDELNEYIESK